MFESCMLDLEETLVHRSANAFRRWLYGEPASYAAHFSRDSTVVKTQEAVNGYFSS